EFTAHAFNVSQVKSETAHLTYTLPAPLSARKGCVYLISLGANLYENPDWNLRFAANDARLLQQTLGERLEKSGQFTAVVRVPLLSDNLTSDGNPGSTRTA